MVKRTGTKRVDRSEAGKYAETGRVFLESAQALSTVADEGAPYGNAIALLGIHATISSADALSIAFGERKSVDEHTKAVDVLRGVLGSRLPNDKAKMLRRILLEKDSVSYQGTYYTLEDGRLLLAAAEEFCGWARSTLETRPT
jgi:hypothetical protein